MWGYEAALYPPTTVHFGWAFLSQSSNTHPKCDVFCLNPENSMKNRILFTLVICALAVAVFVVPSAVLAGDNWQVSGNNAYASYFTSGACSETYVSVGASDNKVRNPPGRPGSSSDASVFISVWNPCDNTQITESGFMSIGKNEFQIDKKLNAATLNTTIKADKYQWQCVADESGYPICQQQYLGQVDVAVNLSWKATGGLSSSTYTDSYQSKFCKSTYTFTGSWRPAQASGSVSDGMTSFTQFTNAELGNSTSGQRVIGCN